MININKINKGQFGFFFYKKCECFMYFVWGFELGESWLMNSEQGGLASSGLVDL